MKSGCYNFHNYLNIKFKSDRAEFFDFVDRNYRFFRTDSELNRAELEVAVYFKGDPPKLALRIASNLFINDGQILYHDYSGFKVHVLDNDSLKVNTYVSPRSSLLTILMSMLRGRKTMLHEKFLAIMRASVHLPLFYLLQSQGFIILHGSAVTRNDEGYLFLGANHVGKTTLALSLVYGHDFKFLADDFLLIRDNRLYSFPEKVRLSPYTLSLLPIKAEGHPIYSKYHLCLPEEKLTRFTQPTKIFFLHTSSTAKIQRIDAELALGQVEAFHNYLHEFPQYSYLAFLPRSLQAHETCDRYATFLANKSLYNLYLSPNYDENMKLILRGMD